MRELRNKIIGLMAAALFIVLVTVIGSLVIGYVKDKGLIKFEGSGSSSVNDTDYPVSSGMEADLTGAFSAADLSVLTKSLDSIGITAVQQDVDMVERVMRAEGATDKDFENGMFGGCALNITGTQGDREAYIAVYLDRGNQRETLELTNRGDGSGLEVSVRDASVLDEVLYGDNKSASN